MGGLTLLMLAMPLQLTIGSVRAKSALKNIMDAAFGGVGYAVLQKPFLACMHACCSCFSMPRTKPERS